MRGHGTRESGKQAAIVGQIRGAIVAGELSPGERLPNRTDLETSYDVSRMTVQKAMDQLARDGFTVARGKLGTFVADGPPCFTRYGIAFADRPGGQRWVGYYDALLRSSEDLAKATGLEFPCYYNIDHPQSGDYQELMNDIRARRLAGLIFTQGPWHLKHTPLLTEHPVPAVAVMTPQDQLPLSDLPTVRLAGSLYPDAVQALVDRDCRRLAVLMAAGARETQLPLLATELLRHNLTYRPAWVQGVALEAREWVAHVVQLWARLPSAERPDGLLIADDNLVAGAVAELTSTTFGRQLKVVAHANFPLAVPTPGLHRIGYDIAALLRHCVELIDADRFGRAGDRHVALSPIQQDAANTVVDATVPQGAASG